MIKSVTVKNYLGETLKMVLERPEETGLAIFNIEGLGAPKATINMSGSVYMDGGVFNSASSTSRNVVFTFAPQMQPTVEISRRKLYKFFPIKKKLELTFETDSQTVKIAGYVESNDPQIFSSAQTIQISIICVDPYFESEETQKTNFYTLVPTFEFPFSNESLTVPLLRFGSIVEGSAQDLFYDGEVEVGVLIKIKVRGPVTNITLFNLRTNESMVINTTRMAQLVGSGLTSGDEIRISTVVGDKWIRLYRGGTYITILNALAMNTAWFRLTKGQNTFTYVAETGATNLQVEMENRVLYEGI